MDRKWWTLIAVCAGTFMLLLDVTIVTVALPDIQRALNAGFGGVQWVVDAYALTLASLLLTAGVVADRYGRRLVFAIGLVIFTLGSLLCGLATSTAMLVASRSGQGVGGAIMFATALALLAQSFQGKDRGLAFGVWGAVTGVAVALGPILGGLITTGISWRGIFLVNIPVGVAALAVTVWRVDESRAPHVHRLDWPGFVTLTLGLLGVVYGLTRASEGSWNDVGVVISLAVGVVLLVSFLVVELRAGSAAMFDLALFRTPTFVGGSVAALAMNGSLFAMFLYLVLYLQDLLGYSALGAGVRLVLISGATLIAATVAGRVSEHMPMRWLVGPGLALVGVGLLLMSGLHPATSWTHLIPGFIVAGIGAGMVNPPLAATAIGVVPPQQAGMASGMNTTFRQVGIATSIATLATIFSAALRRGLDHSLATVPALAGHSAQIVTAVRQGNVPEAIASAPAGARGSLVAAIESAFTAGINDLLTVTGVIALVGAVISTILIRPQDMLVRETPATAASAPGTAALAD